jgi:chromosome segregation ATPase
MAENVLKARITADVSGLKSGLAQAERALDVYSQKIERVQEGIKRSDQQTKLFEVELNKLTSALKSGAINQDEFNKSSDVVKDNISKSRQETAAWQRELIRLEKALQDVKNKEDQVSDSTDNLEEKIKNNTRGMSSANSAAINLTRALTTTNLSAEGLGRSMVAISRDLSRTSVSFGGFGKSAVAVLTSLITPANLVVLGITAVTAAFSLYRKSVQDAEEAQRKSNEAFEASVKKIDEASNSVSGEIAKINALKSVIEDETISRDKRLLAVDRLQKQYPTLFGNLDKEKLLNGQVETSYIELTKAIIARARADEGVKQIIELDKENQEIKNAIKLKEEQLAKETELQKVREKSQTVTTFQFKDQLIESKIKTEELEKEILNLNTTLEDNEKKTKDFSQSIIDYQSTFANALETVSNKSEQAKVSLNNFFDIEFPSEKDLENSIQNYIKSIQDQMGMMSPVEIKDLKINIDIDPETLDIPDGIIENLKKKISEIQKLKEVATDTSRIAAYNQQLKDLESQLKDFNQAGVEIANESISISEQVSGAFSGMAFQISSALNISDRGLKSFVSTIISSTPKIIGALMAKAQASKASAAVTTSANLKEATGDAIVTGGKAAKALGPVGLAVLPVFIAGAVALISKAFSGSGGGGGGAMPSGGGGGASGGSGQTFTNVPGREFGGPVQQGRAYIVGERRPELFIPSSNGIIVPQVPNITNNMMSNAAQNMQVDVNITGVAFGEDILFTVEQASIKRGLR